MIPHFFGLLKKTRKKIIVGVLIVLQLVLVVLFSAPLTTLSINLIVPEHITRVKEGLAREKQFLLDQAKRLERHQLLREAIRENDRTRLLELTIQEQKSIGVDNIFITNHDGKIISRTIQPINYGQYIYESTAIGRRIAEGEAVTAFAKTPAIPLMLISGVPFREPDVLLPAGIFTGYQLDDQYASRFQKEYLATGMNLIFYNETGTISGSSFLGEEDQNTLRAYLSGSANGLLSESVSEDGHHRDAKFNGTAYHVHNFKLTNAEGKVVGGLLLFIPLSPIAVSIMISAVFTLLFFMVMVILRGYRMTIQFGDISKNIYEVLVAVIFFVITLVATTALFESRLTKIIPSPYTIYNSTILLQPDTAVIDKDTDTQVAIVVDTGGEVINAVQAVLVYDPTKVKIRDISTENSFCDQSFFLEKSVDAKVGKISIACGVPGGFQQKKGTIAELRIQPLVTEDFVLRFDPATQVLAHDGLGTNVLRRAVNGYYRVIAGETFEISGGALRQRREPSIRVFSPTNPNSERWYDTKKVQLYWSKRENNRFRYAFNQQSDYIPQNEPLVSHNTAVFPVDKDGIYYFHISAPVNETLSSAVHYKVKVDTTPPPKPSLQISDTDVFVGEIVRFEFKNSDQSPSYQKGFYVSFDGGTFLPVLPQLNIPFLEAGEHAITLKVFDNAENSSESMATIVVRD